MNLVQFLPPIAIPAIILFSFFALLLLIIEATRSRNINKTKHLIMQHVRSSAAKRVSIIVELGRRADTLLPLLDHLDSHEYHKLEVIVIVKQTAGTKAKLTLASYRRKQQHLKLRIVTHRKGLTIEQCAKKYATGELLLRLDPSDRLSPEFLTFASFHFIDPSLNVLIPQSSPRLNQTIKSAASASADLLRDGWMTINREASTKVAAVTLPLRIVTRKRWILGSDSVSSQIYSNQLHIATEDRMSAQTSIGLLSSNWRFRAIAALYLLVGVLLLVSTAVLSSVWFALSICLLGYHAVLITLIIGSRSYDPLAKLNLILFAPFSLIGFLLLHASNLWRQHRVFRSKIAGWSRFFPQMVARKFSKPQA